MLDDTASGQGTITFHGANGLGSTYYESLGMRFQVVVPQGSSFDEMGVTTGGGNTPQDGTAFMMWYRQYNPYDYVSLYLTSGSTFGLTSVWLADPTSPSTAVDTITFVGYKSDGTTVTETFSVGGNNATTFGSYTFDSDFTSGLTSVKIDASRWAMDNLVFTVPEPGSLTLFGIAGLMGLHLVSRRHRGCV